MEGISILHYAQNMKQGRSALEKQTFLLVIYMNQNFYNLLFS